MKETIFRLVLDVDFEGGDKVGIHVQYKYYKALKMLTPGQNTGLLFRTFDAENGYAAMTVRVGIEQV